MSSDNGEGVPGCIGSLIMAALATVAAEAFLISEMGGAAWLLASPVIFVVMVFLSMGAYSTVKR